MSIKSIAGLGFVPLEYLRDALRAFKWSKSSPLCPPQQQLHYDIILLAHTVEKGLSVSNPRPGFGKEKINQLISLLEKYKLEWPLFCVEKSYGCLSEYIVWHESIGFDLGDRRFAIEAFLSRCQDAGIQKKGGTNTIETGKNSVFFEQSLLERHSSRQYAPGLVSEDVLDRIGNIVARTPSQCNRQSARLHYYSDYNQIQQLLMLQGGAEGFRENVNNLFVVSSDISAWSGFKARSQAYVDASLLAMQAMNALQSQNLGYCPLNLAVSNAMEHKICSAGNISHGERLVMMISFGYQIEGEFKVARSARLSTDQLIKRH
jgi:nitroreductase